MRSCASQTRKENAKNSSKQAKQTEISIRLKIHFEKKFQKYHVLTSALRALVI